MNAELLNKAAQAIRELSVDAILQAGSGHVGLPLGCAQLGALLFGEVLCQDAKDPQWPDRDRFVLSAGHGSMLLYSLLHLSGYDLSLDDIRKFRSLGSRTPGHPEYGYTPGVETTTGPLGQGFANAVGMAISESMLVTEFNRDDLSIVDHFTYVLVGEGDLMEGVCYEAASLAGHLSLRKLIVFLDSNEITLDGPAGISFSENIQGRFSSCGWQVLSLDDQSPDAILAAVAEAKTDNRPSLIVVPTTIGEGLPRVKGTSTAHGCTLVSEDASDVRLDSDKVNPFQIAPAAYEYFRKAQVSGSKSRAEWQRRIEAYRLKYPEDYERFYARICEAQNPNAVSDISGGPVFNEGDTISTRVAGGRIFNFLREANVLVGGSADLTVPCFGPDLETHYFTSTDRNGWYIPFGVREHGMGAVINGIALHGGHRAICATFLAFSDYMRPAIRMASLMKLPVIFVFTHDSVKIGQDGPTHQPVEHLASLRAIPGLTVVRPADALETMEAWKIALRTSNGPVALIMTRQDVEVFARPTSWAKEFVRGAYVVRDGGRSPRIVLVGSGSEVQDCLGAADLLSFPVRVVSMPCRETYDQGPAGWKEQIIPNDATVFVVEAGVRQGWGDILPSAHVICVDSFGLSGPGASVANHFGISAESVAKKVHAIVEQ